MLSKLKNMFRSRNPRVSSPHDLPPGLRVLIPEEMIVKVTNPKYLSLSEYPVELTEVQRVGLFLLTQFRDALTGMERASEWEQNYTILAIELENKSRESHGLSRALDEAYKEATLMRERLVEIEDQIHRMKQQCELAELDRAIAEAQIKEMLGILGYNSFEQLSSERGT